MIAPSSPAMLAGITVLVTRPRDSDAAFPEILRRAGARVVWQPSVEIDRNIATPELDAALSSVEDFDWLIFTSAHGVKACWHRVESLGLDPDRVRSRSVAAVGPATAQALVECGIPVALTGHPYSAQGLLARMAPLLRAQRLRILYPRAKAVSPILVAGLRKVGAQVSEVVAYETKAVPLPAAESAAASSGVDCVVFCSPSAVHAVLPHGERFEDSAIACIGPTTAEAARRAGLPVAIVPERATTEALATAVMQYFSGTAR